MGNRSIEIRSTSSLEGLQYRLEYSSVRVSLRLLEEEEVRGCSLRSVIHLVRLFHVLPDPVRPRIDAREVDVSIDGAENEAQRSEDDDGNHSTGYERVLLQVFGRRR